jgi:hypothetical protein
MGINWILGIIPKFWYKNNTGATPQIGPNGAELLNPSRMLKKTFSPRSGENFFEQALDRTGFF